MTRWKSFSVKVRRETIDAVNHFLMEQGSLGMAYDEQLLGASGDPAAPVPPPPEITKLTAYFPWETNLWDLKRNFLEFLQTLRESFGEGPEEFHGAAEITDSGWAEKWKEHFKAQKIGQRLVIKPSWEEYPAKENDVVLTVDPGQAFGTGTHETTRMCLRFIESAFTSDASPPRSVLDIGTGTGILGIAAAMLGAKQVLGIDTDSVAVEVAGKNAELNGVADVFRVEGTIFEAIHEKFDLVLGNLISEILIDLAELISARCAPGGRLVLSGIINEKSGSVVKEFSNHQMKLADETIDGEWTALLFRKEP
ncbi:MAG: 50S ribosomal protein L11 methyltransferase [Syntrophorhabdaceae bacterium]|nr:50S ribosomal protein L11 methyltransferase [Syntrophorhabdaceae bacterium]